MRPDIRLIFLLLITQVILIGSITAYGKEGEIITYAIKPLGGQAEYSDLGLTQLAGKEVRLSSLKTESWGFKDTEKIYSDPETLLPVRVERDVRWWFGRENIIEEYNQRDFKVIITKFKGNRKVSELTFSADGPIYNAVLLPFHLAKVPNPEVGWSFVFRLPQKFEAKLTSLEDIKVGEKIFSTYHFTSVPDKFEVWISNDTARIPLKIKGKGGFNYTLVMKELKMP